MPNPFKVSLYIRVSTDKQANEGDSLDEQERELKKFCEFKGYMIHRTHIEPGRSAKDTKRPEYQKLMADIKDRKINAVVVKKLDRLSRSLMDFEGFMTVAQTHNVEFISLKENFDTTNAMGKAMLRVALVFAQLEREQTSERVSDVFAYRAQNGQYNGGTRPYGYTSISGELMPDKKEAKVIEIMFERFIESKSPIKTAEYLNSLGLRNRNGKLWDAKRVDDMLKRPIYIGKTKWNGVEYKGLHQPIISEACFKAAREIFESRRFARSSDKIPGLLRGFVLCAHCQGPLWPVYTRKKNGKKYFYYRCTNTISEPNKQPCICRSYYPQASLEKNVFEKILEYSTEQKLNAIQNAIDHTNQKITREIVAFKDELSGLEAKFNTLKAKKEKYLDSLVSNNFKASERQRINEKIEEFTLEEKQIKAAIYRQQFEISTKSATLQTIDQFKQSVVAFRINYSNLGQNEIIDWFKKNIKAITYGKEEVCIEFKLLEL